MLNRRRGVVEVGRRRAWLRQLFWPVGIVVVLVTSAVYGTLQYNPPDPGMEAELHLIETFQTTTTTTGALKLNSSSLLSRSTHAADASLRALNVSAGGADKTVIRRKDPSRTTPDIGADKAVIREDPSRGDDSDEKTLKPRAFSPKSYIPCFKHQRYEVEDGKTKTRLRSSEGLFFQKPAKVGGSTAAGVTLRIARNVADRQAVATDPQFPICQAVWQHAWAPHKFEDITNRSKALVWTLVREPTSRILSYFNHFEVARQLKPANADSLRDMVTGADGHYLVNHYIKDLSPYHLGIERKANALEQIQQIIDQYDFIGITDRMDESLVALSILWKLPLADVLYLPAKSAGGFDDGGDIGYCVKIPPRGNVTAEMQQVIDSPEFQRVLGWDNTIYELVNQSLDMTIEKIGRDRFETTLAKFKRGLHLANTVCTKEVTFPCSGGGIDPEQHKRYPMNKTDCISSDLGCGYMCLDDVASELNLWEPHGELSYQQHRNTEFGMGNSTRQRLASRLSKK